MEDKLRTIETATSAGFIKTLLEEKMEQFGFKPDDLILDIQVDLPEIIPLKIKFKKESEGKLIVHNGPELR